MDDEYPEASGYIHVSWCRSFLASNMRFSLGDEGSYAFITIYAYEPHFPIKGYDSLKLDETVDVRSQIEGHFAYTYQ